jgi:hypothetical protein
MLLEMAATLSGIIVFIQKVAKTRKEARYQRLQPKHWYRARKQLRRAFRVSPPYSIRLRLRLLTPEGILRDKGRRHRSRWQQHKMMLVLLCHRQERHNNCNSSKESGHRSQKPLELCTCTDETLDCGTCLATKPFNYALSGH